MVSGSRNQENIPTREADDIWSDPQVKNLDYEQFRNEEYRDLGFNPRELSPVGKEKD